MDVAIIGATGSVGRQTAAQLLERRILPPSARLQLVSHHGGSGEHELWGLRADLEDAFEDAAPTVELVLDASAIDADLVIMVAGATIPTDPSEGSDRAAIGRTNYRMFADYANVLGGLEARKPTVITQSNPVELGVRVFADQLGRERVLGAGGRSDTMRLRAEIAADLGVRRPAVSIPVFGQHGDHLVPAWSLLTVRGVSGPALTAYVETIRAGRSLATLPAEIRLAKAAMLEHVRAGHVETAYAYIKTLTADLRAAVKPFFTHYTSGHTTEMVTARSVVDIVASTVAGEERLISAQVQVDGEWLGIRGVVGAPVILGSNGWKRIDPVDLADDEFSAMATAADAISAADAAVVATAASAGE